MKFLNNVKEFFSILLPILGTLGLFAAGGVLTGRANVDLFTEQVLGWTCIAASVLYLAVWIHIVNKPKQ